MAAGDEDRDVIRAPGAVDTWTPTLVPVMGWLRVTDAVAVSGAAEVVAVASVLVMGGRLAKVVRS